MKNFKLILLIFILIVIVLCVVMIIIKSKKKLECYPITGGSYMLKFETNSDIVLEDMHICIACAPDTYEDIPNLKRDGYDFDGWYYDKNFTNKVLVSNTKDITLKVRKKGDCVVGYQDITLYAKWDIKKE